MIEKPLILWFTRSNDVESENRLNWSAGKSNCKSCLSALYGAMQEILQVFLGRGSTGVTVEQMGCGECTCFPGMFGYYRDIPEGNQLFCVKDGTLVK